MHNCQNQNRSDQKPDHAEINQTKNSRPNRNTPNHNSPKQNRPVHKIPAHNISDRNRYDDKRLGRTRNTVLSRGDEINIFGRFIVNEL